MTQPAPPHTDQNASSALAPVAMLVGLAAEFALGMIANLFVPDAAPSSGPISSTGMGGVVMAHMGLGVALLVGAVAALTLTIRSRGRGVRWSALGLAGVSVATVSGMLYAMSSRSAGYSLLMAVGFLLAAAAYTVQLISAGATRVWQRSGEQPEH